VRRLIIGVASYGALVHWGKCPLDFIFSLHSDFVRLPLQTLLDRIARTTYADAAYCYRPSSVVSQSVCLEYASKPCKNG